MKYIVINETLNLSNIYWLRNQNKRIDKAIGSIENIGNYIFGTDYGILQVGTRETGWLIVQDSEVDLFKNIQISVYDNFNDAPCYIPVTALWERFTLIEKTDISTSNKDEAIVFLTEMKIITDADLHNADLISMVQALETEGLIASGRADEILDDGQ